MRYYVKYCTGVGDDVVDGTLEDAMRVADEAAAYTQREICIADENDDLIAMRDWKPYHWSCDYDDRKGLIEFNDFGFYDRWRFF